MAVLDDLMGEGEIAELIRKNPAILSAALSLLSSRRGSIGPSEGLGDLIGAFGKRGLGDVMASWISTGTNRNIDPGQVADVLGTDALSQFSQKAGVSSNDAGSLLAGLLPVLIDRLTPTGELPQSATLEGSLGSLLGGLGLGQGH
jgi:uncharacterized protein YidB (DUF937 family)